MVGWRLLSYAIRSALEKFGALRQADIALIRWGVGVEPSWTEGSETDGPAAGTALVSKDIASGKVGKVFGVHISAGEGNEFQLGIYDGTTFTVKKRFALASAGTILIVAGAPLIEDVPGGQSVEVRNVKDGTAGVIYQASVLVAEV